jgi:hypothetical protein
MTMRNAAAPYEAVLVPGGIHEVLLYHSVACTTYNVKSTELRKVTYNEIPMKVFLEGN